MTVAAVYLAMILDRIVGEPKQFHPLAGFGHIAQYMEERLSGPERSAKTQQLMGFIAWSILVLPLVVTLGVVNYYFAKNNFGMWLLNAFVLYFCIGANSLEEHVLRVKLSLARGEIREARKNVSYMVSRDTGQLDEQGISKAGIESVLENGSDAIFAPIFWFLIAGAPGALCYRLANTLDAMWGYRNERYLYFGWSAAKLDDLFNWLPARLTSLSYALMGNFQQALHCWHTQGTIWKSPNAGPVMASGAGALNLKLGGAASYHNTITERPLLGCGRSPNMHDIDRAIDLVQRSVLLWLILIAITAVFGRIL